MVRQVWLRDSFEKSSVPFIVRLQGGHLLMFPFKSRIIVRYMRYRYGVQDYSRGGEVLC
jgi:hypothetical protein